MLNVWVSRVTCMSESCHIYKGFKWHNSIATKGQPSESRPTFDRLLARTPSRSASRRLYICLFPRFIEYRALWIEFGLFSKMIGLLEYQQHKDRATFDRPLACAASSYAFLRVSLCVSVFLCVSVCLCVSMSLCVSSVSTFDRLVWHVHPVW